MMLIVLVTLVSAGLSFLCSLMEAAFYSIPPSKLEELRRAGDKGAERLARMREKVDRPIAAILTLNTFANSAGASIAGFLVGREFGDVWVGIYAFIFTGIILYLSEIVPKTLGVTHAERLAPRLAAPIELIARITYKPFIWAAEFITSQIRKGRSGEGVPSEQEILGMAEMGARAGVIHKEEAQLVANVLRLDSKVARDLMTPRVVVYVLPTDLPLTHVKAHSEHWTHSRLPVVKNNDPDQVEGIVHRRDVFDELVTKSPEQLAGRTLRDLMHPAVFVPDKIPCNELLRMFIRERQHLMVVTNEYGGMEGVIALEDVLEFILGEEIVDPHDKHVDMQQHAKELASRRRRPAAPTPRKPRHRP